MINSFNRFVNRILNKPLYMVTLERVENGERDISNVGLFNSEEKADKFADERAYAHDSKLRPSGYEVYRVEEWRVR